MWQNLASAVSLAHDSCLLVFGHLALLICLSITILLLCHGNLTLGSCFFEFKEGLISMCFYRIPRNKMMKTPCKIAVLSVFVLYT